MTATASDRRDRLRAMLADSKMPVTAGPAASRRVLARTPVAPLPASSPTRPVGINGRTSAPPDSSLPDVCSFRLPLTRGRG